MLPDSGDRGGDIGDTDLPVAGLAAVLGPGDRAAPESTTGLSTKLSTTVVSDSFVVVTPPLLVA